MPYHAEIKKIVFTIFFLRLAMPSSPKVVHQASLMNSQKN
jgi:hypothetical protein